MTNYERSNSIIEVDFRVSKTACRHARRLLVSKSTAKRQAISDELLDEIADLAEIDIVKLKISAKKQHHKRSGTRLSMRQYGYYRPGDKYIYINNRTAVRGQILASKTFLNTLLHEWMHHYDSCKLKLDSIHSKGFYSRLKNLQDDLIRG